MERKYNEVSDELKTEFEKNFVDKSAEERAKFVTKKIAEIRKSALNDEQKAKAMDDLKTVLVYKAIDEARTPTLGLSRGR